MAKLYVHFRTGMLKTNKRLVENDSFSLHIFENLHNFGLK